MREHAAVTRVKSREGHLRYHSDVATTVKVTLPKRYASLLTSKKQTTPFCTFIV